MCRVAAREQKKLTGAEPGPGWAGLGPVGLGISGRQTNGSAKNNY